MLDNLPDTLQKVSNFLSPTIGGEDINDSKVISHINTINNMQGVHLTVERPPVVIPVPEVLLPVTQAELPLPGLSDLEQVTDCLLADDGVVVVTGGSVHCGWLDLLPGLMSEYRGENISECSLLGILQFRAHPLSRLSTLSTG